MINAIVCVDKNWCIGKDNTLLFKLQKDMNHFKIMTTGKVVICGRKTLESFPNGMPLKNRSSICLCSEEHNRDDCFCVNTFEKALQLAQELGKTDEVWVIGGQTIYELFLNFYDRVYVTKVDACGDGTAFFPNLDADNRFRCISQLEPVYDNGYNISFCIYERRKGANNDQIN